VASPQTAMTASATTTRTAATPTAFIEVTPPEPQGKVA
jgi:hypothetical protein